MLNLRSICSFLFLILLTLISFAKCEFCSSLSDQTIAEDKLIQKIRESCQKGIIRLDRLERIVEFIKLEHDEALDNVVGYLSNPINAFKLIKRMAIDWNQIHEFIHNGNLTREFDSAWKTFSRDIKLPTESDFQKAIHNLQSLIYGAGSTMTWNECYEIGIRLYDERDYDGAVTWLQRALDKMRDTKYFNEIIRIDVVEYIAISQYLLGRSEEASLTMEQVFDVAEVKSTAALSSTYFLLDASL